MMIDFIKYLIGGTFRPEINVDEGLINLAFSQTVEDINYHYPNYSFPEIEQLIIRKNAELSIFLFRLGQSYYKLKDAKSMAVIHELMRKNCSCEFYFSNEIGTGFYPVHGLGSVIGSRCNIGKGFLIYHNCTIGHLSDYEQGCEIGDNVTMFPGSMILGPIKVANDVVIGANSVLLSDVNSGSVCVGNPAKVINTNAKEELKKHRIYYD